MSTARGLGRLVEQEQVGEQGAEGDRGVEVVDQLRADARLRQHETDLKQNGWWLGQLAAFAQTGESPEALLTYPRRVRALAPDAVRDAARRWLDKGRYVKVTLLPEK
jgi:predicted Zn-dependent peptidase